MHTYHAIKNYIWSNSKAQQDAWNDFGELSWWNKGSVLVLTVLQSFPKLGAIGDAFCWAMDRYKVTKKTEEQLDEIDKTVKELSEATLQEEKKNA